MARTGNRQSRTRHRQTVTGEGNTAGAVTDHSRVSVDFRKGELVFEAKAAKK